MARPNGLGVGGRVVRIMEQIVLTHGYVAIVDDDHYLLAKQYKWHVHKNPRRNTYYARDSFKTTFLHNLLMCPPVGFFVDHVDGNGLNCQRYNMRIATIAQNNSNRPYPNPHGYRGIAPKGNGWIARICVDRKVYRSLLCYTKEDAAKEYDKLALQYHGPFARLNFDG